ncbi:Asp-tRNA(Asn)/Glu-tRNA(Gln) amidotransferase subunit GatA [Eggerthellaceae bacterium zg-1084]|uniref:Glutamyl-tRNA(Gln) amidotransferase subunit A n=1 Tax=Berryella wangjianweii TaxID=2734634 RepID=A0A6M8J2D4_9ACTN|nr:Asp-tRNA(Asn)/Glu-tRNA(Gln) amidotransferase subunit GatA [Berryella wangjianweii]NPD31625.1 Asp-tRNA(Asn)/Glu-tRNA(Gln) amidotransferase subunit GatA [Berryella wangjianweii]NPD32880.1 Asp-tRNA(Asn)/Glu-tRNA(Gln) amidotransferase subunit GatA [Eggerthellaceae bacterium zg-997]QKF07757.1 Asp-tRNA(Asn)/Glu-tRNA(Gln) amidotransferase subunit GatA [Berryella wangjianweii]
MSESIALMSIDQIQDGLRRKRFSAREVAADALARIARFDGAVHAYLELTEDQAYRQADRVDAAIAEGSFDRLGPLAGVPIGFKDNMNLQGTHTTCASRMLESYVSPYTATCVERPLSGGAIPLGKLNMDEFAFGSSTETSAFGRTCNPWDLTRVPGGSSGGSAAAVSAGLATVTLGSDTGGSIRQPGSLCGCVAVKPSYGVVSRYGVVAFGSSLDQVGPFARSVRDAALTLNAIAGHDPRDVTSQNVSVDFTANLDEGVRGMRVGVVPAFMEAEGLDPRVRERVQQAIDALANQGAELVEVELPHAQAAMSAYYVLGPCEAFSNLARFDSVRYGYCAKDAGDLASRYELSRAAGFGAEARRRIMLGSYLLSAGVFERYYYAAQQVRTLITRDYQEAFEKVDCIAAPVCPRTAFTFGEVSDPLSMYLSDMFTISVNIAGNGGMSVPLPLTRDEGLPVGIQLISPQFRDENMFRVAAAVERAFGPAPVAPDFAATDGSTETAGE